MAVRTARLVLVVSLASGGTGLVASCSGGSGAPGGATDAAAQDAPASDGTLADASMDSGAPLEGGPGGGDARGGGSDASDAGPEASHGIPCVVSTYDAGDVDAGDAGDGGEGGASGDAGPPASSCPGAMACCAGFCTDTSKDPGNCGACGTACSATQFCTGASCDDAVLKNLCANHRATVVTDSYVDDNSAGAALGAALAGGCTPAPGIATVAQDAGTAEDPVTGRPLTGPGNTLVAGGGFFGQAEVSYMQANKLSPLVLGTDGTNAWILNTKTGANVVMTPNTSLTAQHDYFALEVSVEPVSGTLCFSGYGMLVPGTRAAAFYFQNDVVTSLSTFPGAWYVYEWTDADGSGGPSAGDTFTPVANGS